MSTKQQNTTQTAQSKKRVQLNHLLLDFNFPDKDKTIQLLDLHGPTGCWCFTCILCAMTNATDGAISKVSALRICMRQGVDKSKAQEIISFLISKQMLHESGELISNTRIIEDQEAFAEKRDKWKDRQQRHRQISGSCHADVTQMSHTKVGVTPDNDTDNDTDNEDLKRNCLLPLPPTNIPTDPEPNDEADTLALEKLESPEGKQWVNSSQYMNAGRRPMRDYPEIWLSPVELADVIREWQNSNIPPEKWRKGFKSVQARLRTHAVNGKPPERVSVYNWLTGFGRNDLIEETIKDKRLERVNTNATTIRRTS